MKNILLVDDEPLVIVTLKSLIDWEKYDFQIIMTVSNGEEALNYVLHHTEIVDIIISDVDMPKMNGIDLGLNLRLNNINIPIIFLSAYNNFDYVRDAFHNGACDYLLKNELDENKIIEVITSDKISKNNNSINSKLTINDDRKSYVSKCINGVDDEFITFEKLDFKIAFPLKILFLKINEIEKVGFNLEITTILEQEGLDLLNVNLTHYVLLVPRSYNIKTVIKRITSNLWNFMDLSVEYKISDDILNEKKFKEELCDIYNKFTSFSRLVITTRKFINENYKDPSLNLSIIADYVGVSKNHLSKEYSKEVSETIGEYISKIRIREAKKLLESSYLKSYEIADLIGFSNSETFFRTFKKVTGITTKTYQKS